MEPFSERKPYTLDRIVRSAITIAIFIAIVYFLGLIKGVLVPFAIALIIAYTIHPFISFIERIIPFLGRVGSTILGLFSISGFFYLLILFTAPLISTEIQKTISILRIHFSNVEVIYFLPEKHEKIIIEYFNNSDLHNLLNPENIEKILEKLIPKIWSLFTSGLGFILSVLSFFVVFIYVFFMLIYYEKIMEGWPKLIPTKYQSLIVRIISDLNVGMNSYFRAQAIIAAIVGVLFSLGFIIIDLPSAILLGILFGILNLVPYLQIAAFPPALFLGYVQSIATGESFGIIFLQLLGVFIVVQGIQETILIPKIMGRKTGLNPVVILLSLSIWGALLGILGMLIALPLTTVIFSYYKHYILKNDNLFSKTENNIL